MPSPIVLSNCPLWLINYAYETVDFRIENVLKVLDIALWLIPIPLLVVVEWQLLKYARAGAHKLRWPRVALEVRVVMLTRRFIIPMLMLLTLKGAVHIWWKLSLLRFVVYSFLGLIHLNRLGLGEVRQTLGVLECRSLLSMVVDIMKVSLGILFNVVNRHTARLTWQRWCYLFFRNLWCDAFLLLSWDTRTFNGFIGFHIWMIQFAVESMEFTLFFV